MLRNTDRAHRRLRGMFCVSVIKIKKVNMDTMWNWMAC